MTIMDNANFNLNQAAYSGNMELALLAVKQGADIFADDNEALKTAVRYNKENIVDFLISCGANPNEIGNSIVTDTINRQNFKLFKNLVNNHGFRIDDVFQNIIVKSVCYGTINYDFAEFAINNCNSQSLKSVEYFLKDNKIIGKNKDWLEMIYQKRVLELSTDGNAQHKKIKI